MYANNQPKITTRFNKFDTETAISARLREKSKLLKHVFVKKVNKIINPKTKKPCFYYTLRGLTMNPTDFIYKNINQLLIQDGFSELIASSSADKGVAEYKRRCCASQNGKIFDDCLKAARKHAKELIKSAH